MYNKQNILVVLGRVCIKLIQIVLFLLIQIVMIPFAIVGLLIGLYKEMHLSKKYDVSFSAIQSLQYRWYMHYFNTRPDQDTVDFTKAFPCESHFGLWTTMGALIIAERYLGLRTKFGRLVETGKETIDTTASIRVIRFDEIIQKHLDEVEQIVIPGAGFDLISNRFTQNRNVKVFEIDQTNTQRIKRETLSKAGIDHDWINYVPVDYSIESWSDKLLSSGFDKNKKTLFIWQSVSLYLEDNLVRESIQAMCDLSCPGSIIVQDFYSEAFMTGQISTLAVKNMNMIAKMGEPWKFVLDMSNGAGEAIDLFLDDYPLEVTDHIEFGSKLKIEPFYSIVSTVKK